MTRQEHGPGGRALRAGGQGAVAAAAAGAFAGLVFMAGFAVETGGTFAADGRDFVGWLSLIAASCSSVVAFPVFAYLLFRRNRLGREAGAVPASVVVTYAAGGNAMLLSATWPHSPTVVVLAVVGVATAALCFAAVALGLDERAAGRRRAVAFAVLVIVLAPSLFRIF
ncbi:hypothetical protein [Actinocorallia herbida]|nr:hypothetical protein [Actinocorallia herbida]